MKFVSIGRRWSQRAMLLRPPKNPFLVHLKGMIGASEALKSVLAHVKTVAPTDSTVLLEGGNRHRPRS